MRIVEAEKEKKQLHAAEIRNMFDEPAVCLQDELEMKWAE